MSPFDETLLSAYLDGELDPESSRRVEEAMRADPDLGRELRELSRVRGLVAGLHRPPESEAPDVSGAVVGRIERSRARRRAYPPFAAAASLAAAAILVISILNGWNNAPIAEQPIGLVDRSQERPIPRPSPTLDTGAETEAEAEGVEVVESTPPDSGDPGPVEGTPEVVVETAPPGNPDLIRFAGELAAHPDSLQLTIEAPPGSRVEDLFQEVDGLLRLTVREDRRYGMLSPGHSGGVGGFAFLAGPDEWEKLFRRLEDNLEDRARFFEPTAGTTPEALFDQAPGLGLELLASEPNALLRDVDPGEELVANRHPPEDELSMPATVGIPPSLPGALRPHPGGLRGGRRPDRSAPVPVPVPAPVPVPVPDPDSGAASPDGEWPGVVVIWIRPGD